MAKKKFIVYRVSSKSEKDLVNRNAGSLEAIVDFVDETFEKQLARGDWITQWEVTYDGEFGPYVALLGGRKRGGGETAPLVGRVKSSNPRWPKEVYSFPEGADYKAKKLKSMSLKKAAPRIMDDAPWSDGASEGSIWALGGLAIRDHMAAVFKEGGKRVPKCKFGKDGEPIKTACALEDVRAGRATLVEYVDSLTSDLSEWRSTR
jgi:hypothetical protein